jgi:hypothetical protein
MDTTSKRTAAINCASIMIITAYGRMEAESSNTYIFCASIMIIAVNWSVYTISSVTITRIIGTKVVIITRVSVVETVS